MIGFKINIDDAKAMFFDRKVVIDAVTRAEKKVLSRIGAYIMRDARKSIKEAKGPSEPGSPPHGHTFRTVQVQRKRKGVLKTVNKKSSARRFSTAVVPRRLKRWNTAASLRSRPSKTANSSRSTRQSRPGHLWVRRNPRTYRSSQECGPTRSNHKESRP